MNPRPWIERYRRAWETVDADEIVALFTPDASYRSSVFRDPFVGSDAIRAYWLRGAGTQREVAVRMGQPIITADRVVVEWWATMIDPDDGEITLPGCLLLRFAPDGAARTCGSTDRPGPAGGTRPMAGAPDFTDRQSHLLAELPVTRRALSAVMDDLPVVGATPDGHAYRDDMCPSPRARSTQLLHARSCMMSGHSRCAAGDMPGTSGPF